MGILVNVRKMKSNRKYYIYILVMAVLYGLQYYINNKITPVGDQTAFLKYAKEFHHQYFTFGLHRYFTWSSRLLIESATLLFSVHEKIFLVVTVIASYFLLIPSKKLIPSLPLLPALIIFFSLPASEFLSAGSIPTYTNYIFPASFLFFSLYYRYSDNLAVRFISFFSFIFSIMNEQLAAYAFLWIIFELFHDWKNKVFRYRNFLYLFLSFMGILSAKISPGNAVRFTKEVATWFPNYTRLNIFQKLSLGILETADGLLSVSFSFVFLLLIILIVLSVYKKNFLSLSFSVFIFLSILSQKLEWRNPLFTLSGLSKIVRESGTFKVNIANFGVLIYNILLFFMLTYIIWSVTNSTNKLWLSYLFIIGILARLIISFSPTLYASGTRTYLPVMISIFVITCELLNEVYSYFKQTSIGV